MRAEDFDEVSRLMFMRERVVAALKRLGDASDKCCSVEAIVFGGTDVVSNRLSTTSLPIDIEDLEIDPSDRGAKFLTDVYGLLNTYLSGELRLIEDQLRSMGMELE
ncbi:hypothetical protein [Hyphomicrobium sp.]|uniref:hypothetical protein n=1 Tax=Hyphomicrobium sp. TaxID=82 RepID=UPI003F7181CF